MNISLTTIDKSYLTSVFLTFLYSFRENSHQKNMNLIEFSKQTAQRVIKDYEKKLNAKLAKQKTNTDEDRIFMNGYIRGIEDALAILKS